MAKVGRPSKYQPEFAEQAKNYALLGAIDSDLARIFETSEATINTWKKQHPEFLEALKAGKDDADAQVAKSLYRRALGFSHPAVKIVTVAGETKEVPYTEQYPPDTTAAIFWLKNRQPRLWRDVHKVEHTGAEGGPIEFNDTEAAARIAAILEAGRARKEKPDEG